MTSFPKGRLNRETIRAIVNAKLAECGFDAGIYRWRHSPAQLEILIGANVRTIAFKSGMAKRDLSYELARLDAWADFVCRKKGLKPKVEQVAVTPGKQIDLEELLA